MNNAYSWYSLLIKPSWAPPNWLFGPVWSLLYVIIAITFGYVFYRVAKGELPRAVATPFILNLIFNFAFSPIQFTLRNNLWACADILLVLMTQVWAANAIWRYDKRIVYANIPYGLWVSFATILQINITLLNL